MRVALIQLDLAWEDAAENHRRASRRLAEAADAGARLALLPEMFATGFSMNAQEIAQAPGGESERFLREEARRRGLWIAGSIAERGAARPRNMLLFVSPSGEVTRYAKIHPFTFAGEERHYEAGDRLVSVEVEGVRVTPFICYDLRFPEAFRAAAARTDLFAVVANWPDARREHWRTLLKARAIENQAYVAGVNRVGEGGGLRYAGDSALISPAGEAIVEGDAAERVLVAEVEPAEVAAQRRAFPMLGDVRPQAYRR